MKKSVVFLFIGIVLTCLGFYQFWQYENNSVTVEATVSDIETKEGDSDSASAFRHIYYGDYTVDGKEYKNKKLATRYSNEYMPDMHIGDKIEIVVDASNPGRRMTEGGIFGMVGLVMVVWNAVAISKIKTADKENEAVNK